jgi:magnesium chelatase family protein
MFTTDYESVIPSKVYSAAVVGIDAFEVEIEVHAGWGNTDKIAVVGLPDTAIKESKDRVTSAICNSALRWRKGSKKAQLSPTRRMALLLA